MKKILLAILFAIVAPLAARAQTRNATIYEYPTDYIQHAGLQTKTAAGTVDWNIRNGVQTHQFTFQVPSTISAISVEVFAKTEAGAYTSVGTSTSLGATITWSGTYNAGRVVYSGVTGTGSINGDYYGQIFNAATGGGATLAVQLLELIQLGDIADNTLRTAEAAESTAPVAIACITRAFGSNPTAGSANADIQPICDRQGVLRTLGGPANAVPYSVDFTGTSDDVAIISVSSGTKIGLTRALFSCGAENTNSIDFTMGFGATNTPLTGAGVILRTTGTTPNALSGLAGGSADGLVGIGADGEDLRFDSGNPSGTCTITITYFTIES